MVIARQFLKRKRTLFRKKQSFVEIDCSDVLMSDVIDACNMLNRGCLVVEVFCWDLLNGIISPHSLYSFQKGHFTYHIVDSLNSLAQCTIQSIRYLEVFTISGVYATSQNVLELKAKSPFCFSDDNYMEVFEFVVDPLEYSPSMIAKFVNEEL